MAGDVSTRTHAAAEHIEREVTLAQSEQKSRNIQVHNRAQQRLDNEEKRHREMVELKAASRQYIERNKATLVELQRLIAQEEANLADMEQEDRAILKSITSLREDGVEL